jgi:signal transduction histidine kinase
MRSNRTLGSVALFAAVGLVAMAAVAGVAALLLRDTGEAQAVSDAKKLTELVGHGVVEPAIRQSLVKRDPKAIAALDTLVRRRVLGDVRRVKIWAPDGTILYSDEARLIGRQFPLGADELDVLYRTPVDVDAGISDLHQPENRFEQGAGDLVEVYSRIRLPNGDPLLFEAYVASSAITSSSNAIWRSFLPIVLVGLAVLYLALLPLAWLLARRLGTAHREREAMLERSLQSVDRERRRIAADLHDGVVQDLAGLSFELEAAARRSAVEEDPARFVFAAAADRLRVGMRDLRTLLVDIYPPTVRRAGLRQALTDLAATLEPSSVVTAVEIPVGLELPGEREELIYRVAREALRNAYRHSGASRVTLRLERQGDDVVLTVEDDGVGIEPGAIARSRRAGHFGLTALGDLSADAGAALSVGPVDVGGTRLSLVVPA